MAFDKYVAPTLPFPSREYDPKYFIQMVRSLRTFFDIINSPAAFNAAIVTPTMLRTPITTLPVADGNNDELAIPPHTFLRAEGPTADFAVRGINSHPHLSNDGRQLIIYNSTAYKMTLYNEELTVTAEYRIITGTGATVDILSNQVVSMIYSVKDLRWIVVSHSG